MALSALGTILSIRARSMTMAVAVLMAGTTLAAAACGNDRQAVEIGSPGSGATGSDGTGGAPPPTDGGVADSAEILKTYGKLAATAIKGRKAAASAAKTLEDIAAKLPKELQGDLAVVGAAFGELADKGVVTGATALTTTEFVEANKSILRFLRQDCLPG